ncbi:MAG: hypothetical protein QHJ81_16390 [Anaerolineae bacterium]|nr:hypothetical protein [Anaerolineae bacterium]
MKDPRDEAWPKTANPQNLPAYEPPQVLSYHEDKILEMLGPAQACSFYGSVMDCNPLLPFSPGLPVLRP